MNFVTWWKVTDQLDDGGRDDWQECWDAAVFFERERCARIAASLKIDGANPDEYEGGCNSTAAVIESMILDGDDT